MSPIKALSAVAFSNLVVVAAAVARGISKAQKPGLYFGEGRFTMFFSLVQLLAVAALSFAIFRGRRLQSSDRHWAAPQNLWLLIGLGFVFLTADEIFQIHEKVDQIIHAILGITQTDFTSMIDDFIIGAYLCLGLATLWLFRAEMKAFRVMLFPLVCGFVCGGFSVVSDALAHHEDFLLSRGVEEQRASVLVQWADVGDGGFTLLAEGCFVVAFFLGWRRVQTPSPAEVAFS